jgi:3-hydroxyisobutyrate dehydrogenase
MTTFQIGYIGLGIMGQSMAGNLIKAGHKMHVWNRTAAKMRPLVETGAIACDSPADMASRDVSAIFINVTDTPDVGAVLFGEQGLATTARAGLITVDHSTISPIATQEFAQRLAAQGVTHLDAPVSGGDVGARNATLSIMVGGLREGYETVLPLLQCMGKNITHVGDSGAGQTCKACNQIAVSINLLGVCEAIAMAKANGLDPRKMLEVVSAGAGGSWQISNLGPKILDGDFEPGFMIDYLLKDLNIVQQVAREKKLPLTTLAHAEHLYRSAQVHGSGAKGTQAVSHVIDTLANMK